MLASSTIPELTAITYPVIASIKLDGIRCLIKDGIAVSRNLKPIPNKFIQKELAKYNLEGCDGELLVHGDFNSVQSAVMSQSGEPDFTYYVFDYFLRPNVPFVRRLVIADEVVRAAATNRVVSVKQLECASADRLHMLYETWIKEGYEGAIIRATDSPYKHGRSTLHQGWMLKLKPVNDDEAKVIGYEELLRNGNLATIGELGQQTRSKELAGMVPGDMLGSLKCEYQGKEFFIGSGFTEAQRIDLWKNKESLIGKLVTFKFQELSKYGVPRFPVFKGFRDENDIS